VACGWPSWLWSISSSASIAIFTALGGLLADLTSTRTALAVAGLLVRTSPLLLPRRLGASSGAKVRPSRA
jgi:hypothetical protein